MEFLRFFLLLEILIWVVMTLTRFESSLFLPLWACSIMSNLNFFTLLSSLSLSLFSFWVGAGGYDELYSDT